MKLERLLMISLLSGVVFTFVDYAAAAGRGKCPSPGFALQFGGANQVEVPNDAALYPQGQFTIEFWFKSTGRFLNGCFVNGTNGYYVTVEHGIGGPGGPPGAGFAGAFQTAGYVAAYNYGDFWDGQWHHYALVYNGDGLLLYIDGVPGDPINYSIGYGHPPIIIGMDALAVGSGNFYLGQAGEGSHGDGGIVDEFRISNIARYSSDFSKRVRRLRCLGRDAYTVAYWQLEEGTGDVAHDSSGNSHDGALQGDPPPAWVAGR